MSRQSSTFRPKFRKRWTIQMAVCVSRRWFILKGGTMNKETSASLQETLEKIVKSAFANDPDKAQIEVVRVDHSLYREIRIDNHGGRLDNQKE